MIDEVHMLTNTAFNAMLKTLEEPPGIPQSSFWPPPIRRKCRSPCSRCLQFNLRPMAPETVSRASAACVAGRASRCGAPGIAPYRPAARGSMRDALSLTDQAIAFGGGRLEESAVRQMLGSVDRSHVFRLISALAASDDGLPWWKSSDKPARAWLESASTLEEMAAVLQRDGRFAGRAADGWDDQDPDAAEISAWRRHFRRMKRLLYSLCLHGRSELGLAPDEYAALTMVLLRLLAFKPATTATAEKNSE